MLNEVAGVLPPVAFCNIGWDGCRRASDLRRQSEQLVAGKRARQPVAGLRQSHGILPHLQVPIRIDRWVAQKPSLFAIRYSLFTTSFLVSGKHGIIRAFPGREEIEFA